MSAGAFFLQFPKMQIILKTNMISLFQIIRPCQFADPQTLPNLATISWLACAAQIASRSVIS